MDRESHRTVQLKAITTKIGSGATPRGGERAYKESGIALIRSLNVYDLYFDVNKLAFIDETQASGLANVTVAPEDILLNITGSVARCAMVPLEILPARVNQHVAIIRVDKSKACPYFVLYVLVSPHYKNSLLSLVTGATRIALTKITIENFEIPLPPLETQRKIAAILSTYDDLIENNNKRIKLLEQAAHDLYREWFVHFRFPGHEDVKMVDSGADYGMIPRGWNVIRLGDVAEVNARNIRKGHAPREIEYIDISSMSTGRVNYTTTLPFVDAPSRARRQVRHGDIIWATVRPNRRLYALILRPGESLIASTGFAVITPKRVPYTYLYHAVTTHEFAEYLTNRATGSAYPAVSARDFNDASVIVPEDKITAGYQSIVADIYDQNLVLQNKNTVLRKSRDLLLPHLVSGELNVSETEI